MQYREYSSPIVRGKACAYPHPSSTLFLLPFPTAGIGSGRKGQIPIVFNKERPFSISYPHQVQVHHSRVANLVTQKPLHNHSQYSHIPYLACSLDHPLNVDPSFFLMNCSFLQRTDKMYHIDII